MHDRDLMRHKSDEWKVVRDEDIRQATPLLKRHQNLYHLSLYRYVQCRNRFIENEDFRFERERSSDRNSLPLPA